MRPLVGVDPGTGGGLAILRDEGVMAYNMPEDPIELRDLLRDLHAEGARAVIEQIPKFCGQRQIASQIHGAPMATLFGNYQLVVGLCLGIGIEVTQLTPQHWQRVVECRNETKLPRTKWKNKLKARAQEIYPDLKVTLATADALLIAYALLVLEA